MELDRQCREGRVAAPREVRSAVAEAEAALRALRERHRKEQQTPPPPQPISPSHHKARASPAQEVIEAKRAPLVS